MNMEERNIEDLKPAQYNPRKADEKEWKGLEESIREFGLVDPVIVNSAPSRKDIIIGGHFRVKVAQKLGFKTVPVVYVSIEDEAKERELNLRLNKNLGAWDWDLLAQFDRGILELVGFEDLDRLLKLDMPTTPAEVPQSGSSKSSKQCSLCGEKSVIGFCNIHVPTKLI